MNALVPTTRDDFMPVMDMTVAIQRRQYVIDFTKRIMVKDTDYGIVPGTGSKPTLLKPGAEKLATFFGLTPVFVLVKCDEDWLGDNHGGEPFFYYHYRCELHRNGNLLATSEGSCNSWESKYRYRKGERVCPECGEAAIIKGKAEYGGGWLCFKKIGGCGAKFSDADERVAGQEVGRIANPDVADQVNTFQKMAQKRALVAAVLLAVNASEFFTQDVEDLITVDGEWTQAPEPTPPPAPARNTTRATPQPRTAPPVQPSADVDMGMGGNPFDDAPPATNDPQEAERQTLLRKLHAIGHVLYADKWDTVRHKNVRRFTGQRTESSKEMTIDELSAMIAGMEQLQTKRATQPEPVAA